MSTVDDGTGKKYQAKVDSNFRLHTRSITAPEIHDANENGDAYNINTGVVTLTTANDSAVLYVKNTDDKDLHIEAIAVGLGPTTGGSGGIPKITVVRNPTGGTIVSGATNVDIKGNRNFGSTNAGTNITAYKGDGTALTLTGSSNHLIFFQTASGRLYAEVDEILPKGASIGVLIDPQAGNTSMDCYVALVCYLREAGL